MNDEGPRLLTVEEVAEKASIPKADVRRWAVENRIFSVTDLEHGTRYAADQVERVLRGEEARP